MSKSFLPELSSAVLSRSCTSVSWVSAGRTSTSPSPCPPAQAELSRLHIQMRVLLQVSRRSECRRLKRTRRWLRVTPGEPSRGTHATPVTASPESVTTLPEHKETRWHSTPGQSSSWGQKRVADWNGTYAQHSRHCASGGYNCMLTFLSSYPLYDTKPDTTSTKPLLGTWQRQVLLIKFVVSLMQNLGRQISILKFSNIFRKSVKASRTPM